MSECVVRMKKYENCLDCDLHQTVYGDSYADTDVYCFKEKRFVGKRFGPIKDLARPSWCPIIGELPEQHGDLIDRDKAIFEMCEGLAPNGYRAWAKRYLKSEKINPTIVPATERSEEK